MKIAICMLNEHICVAYTMLKFSKTNPSVYNSFQYDLLIVRRSDRFSADLSSDLVILQVLLRSIKTTGGLTRRRGFTDSIELYGFFQHPLRLR